MRDRGSTAPAKMSTLIAKYSGDVAREFRTARGESRQRSLRSRILGFLAEGDRMEFQRIPGPEDPSGGWDAIAREFVAHRNPVIGTATVRQWTRSLPAGAAILDIGCGFGVPFSTALAGDGFGVHGIDASPELVAEFRRRLPGVPVRCEPAETSTFFGRQFDAAMAIGLVFLLDEQRQRQLIHRVSTALHPGGKFLFTAPTQDATWKDILTGRESRSLGKDAYTALLREAGLSLVGEFTDEGENHYYDTQRLPTGAGQAP